MIQPIVGTGASSDRVKAVLRFGSMGANLHVDGYQVTDEEAVQMACVIAREEEIFAVASSGANVPAAIGLVQTHCRRKTIAVPLGDPGLSI